MSELRFSCPLPPPALRANSRAHWARKKKDADEYSAVVVSAWGDWCLDSGFHVQPKPWKAADVHYEWRYAGVEPDHSNLGGHTKYLQDIICLAPKLSMEQAAKYKRWHLGLVENDKGIHATYEAVKVPKRDQECVEVIIRRREPC